MPARRTIARPTSATPSGVTDVERQARRAAEALARPGAYVGEAASGAYACVSRQTAAVALC